MFRIQNRHQLVLVLIQPSSQCKKIYLMFLNSSSWPVSLLCRFLPTEFRSQDVKHDVIRFDDDDGSTPVDRLDEFGRFVPCEYSVEELRSLKRRHIGQLKNGSIPGAVVSDVTSVKVQGLQATKFSRRPLVLTQQNSVDSTWSKSEKYLNYAKQHNLQTSNSHYFNSSRHLENQSNVRNPGIDCQESESRNPHVDDSARIKLFKDSHIDSFKNSNYQKCNNKNGIRPNFCSKLSTSTSRNSRKGCSHKYPPKKHSLDNGFGFLTPETKARLGGIRKDWQSNSDLFNSLSLDINDNISLLDTDINSLNLQSFESGYSSLALVPKPGVFSDSLSDLIGKFENTEQLLSPQPSDKIEDSKDTAMEVPEELKKFSHKYQFHDETLSYLKILSEDPMPDHIKVPVHEGRDWSNRLLKKFGQAPEEFDGSVRQFIVPSIKCKGMCINYKILKMHSDLLDEMKSLCFTTNEDVQRNAVWSEGNVARKAALAYSFAIPKIPHDLEHVLHSDIVRSRGAGIPVDIIRPKTLPQVPSIVIYFHGGGMVFGSRKTTDSFCKILSREANCVVVNVEYRLAPENKFPAPFDDAKCVVRWVKMNLGLLGAVLESKIGVAGDSAGGQIAASVSHLMSGLDFQVLIYPVLDLNFNQPSMTEFENGPGLTKHQLEWSYKQFLNKDEERNDPIASPLLRSDFTKQPKTFLLIAQIDPLRDAIYDYKQKLKECDVPVTSYLVRGAVHGFFKYQGHYKSLCDESYQQVIEFVKSIAYWDEITLGGQKNVVF
ncbi:hypothetical protein LOTGIDRAFT_236258 [Lottia gigantea]|uniref:Alpha/beta hydrolase fold-3 domain-containing protein n=1 Tax=Lottia gigantea TaxID=225164 RepID=V3ZJQ5_LOTGI|nr:hypothetical protein LOTGIDRAFT_236258 [Lottia gigantea]ESO84467.1 hypothetical protein LOTGIDRAFT_236258 [Lottia gigantea]